MKFRVSRVEPIRWPDKCAWCGGKPTMKYEISGRGLIGGKFRLFSATMEYGKVEAEYPVCQKHGLWLTGIHTAHLVSFLGMVLGWIVHYWLSLVLGGVFFWTGRLNLISIRGVTAHFYTMVIRNDDYAREFALLNNLDPL